MTTRDSGALNQQTPGSISSKLRGWIYFVVAITSLASLLLELSLTRVFSVVYYYHFAFLAISIALFGLGAGGVFSYVVAGWRGTLFARLGWLSALNSVLVALLLVWLLSTSQSYWQLPLTYFLAGLPFFVTGTIVALVISETIEHVDRVYFFDLLGAAGGCMLLIPLLNFAGGPSTVLAASVLFAAAAAVWYGIGHSRIGVAVTTLMTLALVFLTVFNARHNSIDVHYAHGKRISSEWYVKWNSFSRVSISLDPDSYQRIFIDATTSTPIVDSRLGAREGKDPLEPSSELPCLWRPSAKVLVIGPGGGLEIARCLAGGSRDITGVEINPIIAKTIMRDRFPGLSQGLYLLPQVHIVVEDGRSFVRRTSEKFQVLQLTLIGNWGSTNAGAYALTENSLYTVDAFRDYMAHLTDDGIMAVTRWTLTPPSETLRMVAMAMEALNGIGESEPWRNVIVARERGGLDTIVISRRPFTQTDLSLARSTMDARAILAAYLPGDQGQGPGFEFAELLRSPDPGAFERGYTFDITPVSDNRPFFFFVVQPRDVLHFLVHPFFREASAPLAVPMLFAVIGISIVATLVILTLPPLLLGSRLPSREGALTCLLYFVCIGAGYILIEVTLVQRFILFLGQPTYALTVVIFSMLVFSSLGSRFSRTFLQDDVSRLLAMLAAISLLVVLLGVLTYSAMSAAVALALWLKVAITIFVIAPLAFAMGMPFPTALKWLEGWHHALVRWAWAVNAASSVLGSVGALVLSLFVGLFQTILAGSILYLVALTALWAVALRGQNSKTVAAA